LGNTIKIHRELPAKIATDSGLLKAMAVFYGLKFLYVGGIIVNITGRYSEISGRLGISPNNLRGKIKTLQKIGILTKSGRNITFSGYEAVGRTFGTKSRRSFRIPYADTKKIELLLKALAIESNLEKQRYRVKDKIIGEELKRYGKIEAKTIRNKIKKYIRKNISFYAENYKKRVSQRPSTIFRNSTLNTTTTVSRNCIAKIVGRRSKSTGCRLVKKLAGMNLLETDNKRISMVCHKADRRVLRYMELDSSFFVFKNRLYKRECNQVAFNKFFA
jgi:DNA-binding Lrp family transcriptional regulator